MPSQPSINRGTLILLAPDAKDATISSKNVFFTFQYNPEKLLHTFNQPLPSETTANLSSNIQSVPSEFFNLTFELDSMDLNLPSQIQASADLGVHPALAMLELMMQPQVVGSQTCMPIVVFKWGAKRAVAVRFVSFDVEENSFDITLNPTRATVSLILRVLNVSEVGSNVGARSVCLNHQNARASLIDAYKFLTGQPNTIQGVGAAAGVSESGGSATAASGVERTSKKVA